MADEEVRVPPEPRPFGQAMPNRGKPRDAAVIEGTAEELLPADVRATDIAANDIKAEQDETLHRVESAAPTDDMLRDAGEPPTEPARSGAFGSVPPTGTASGTERVSTSPMVEPATPRRSRMPLLLSLLGLMLILMLGALLYRLYDPAPDDSVAALTTEMSGLKQRIAALEARPTAVSAAPNLAPLQDRLSAIEGTVAQLKTDLADTQSARDASKTAAPAETAANAAPSVDLGPIQSKLADLGQSITALQGTVAALPKVDLGPIDAKVADLGQTVASLQGAVAALPHVDLAPLSRDIAALNQRVTPLETALSAPKSDARATEARQEGSAAETRAAPIAVTAQVIEGALHDGRSFMPEVTALKALGVSESNLAPLTAVADKGAATDAMLITLFGQVRDKMLGAGAPKPTGNVLDRMLASAQGLVKVRPAGETAGNDPDAVVSRIDADLNRADLNGALGEWQKLPDDGKAASQSWADRLKARVDAQDAARAIVAGAVTAFGSTK
ncbi:COG4223 family protein [Lichenihabitans psoromatis]|uniref:COG4223 family protein n=1 Tax=Lichenihabitans psoromatis TaxID=2528642 RepID=UPI00103635C6|nr:hypothetical protein [Lichenihabitans psoromatis]